MRRASFVSPERGVGRHLRSQDCGEGGPIAPEQENEKSRDDEREWKPFGGEEDMEEDDIRANRLQILRNEQQ